MGGVWSAPRQKVAGRGLKILDERHKHSWVYIRKKQNTNSKRYRQPSVHSSIMYNCQDLETTCPLTEEWIKKMRHTHTIEHYSDIKRNDILPSAATWMGLVGIMLSAKYCMISLICALSKINQ